MILPSAVRERLATHVGQIEELVPLSRGIQATYRLNAAGRPYFLKYAPSVAPDTFSAEAAGLDLLRSAGSGLVVPAVMGKDANPDGSWILLEWLEHSPASDFSPKLGRGVAAMHQVRSTSWGWEADGFIGRLPQSNRRHDHWWEFWWKERLLPQLQLAGDIFGSVAGFEELPRVVERLLGPAEHEGPSLLHGDLWHGNVMSTAAAPAIYDPACYFGHREADLAMTELFGGFDEAFYAVYDEVMPRPSGHEWRSHVYQLYYLLVHVNLFGQTYVERTRDTLRRVLAA